MDSSSFEPSLKPSNIYLPKCWSKFLDKLSTIDDLADKLALVNKAKFHLKNEVARLATSELEPFSMAMEFLTNALISLEEVKECIVKDMGKFKTPFTFAVMAKNEGVAKEGTLQGRCFASSSGHEGTSSNLFGRHLQKAQMTPYLYEGRALNGIIASPLPSLASGGKNTSPTCPYIRIKETLFGKGERSSGAALFDAEHHRAMEVTRNSCKRKRAFEESINKKDGECHGVCFKADRERVFLAPFREPPHARFANPPVHIPASVVAFSRAPFRPSLLDEVNRRGGRF